MHELSVTENILEIALRYAAREVPAADPVRIKGLNIVIGQLSSIVDDSVQFYWDIISQGTIAEGAQLNFRRIPAELACQTCGHQYPLSGDDFLCPSCRSALVKIISGEEFYLESMDVETET